MNRFKLAFSRSLVAALSLSFSAATLANYRDFAALLPAGSQMGFVLMQPDGTVTASHNGDQLLLPASTLKLVTATAAWLQLGESFRFTTTIETGEITDGVANGDLVIRMSGDPTLKRPDLFRLVRELKNQGLHTINGNIRFDDSLFRGYNRAPGWPWDDLGICFSAPISQVMLDGNCAHIRLTLAGNKVVLNKPSHLPLDIRSEVTLGAMGPLCPLEMDIDGKQYQLRGCTDRPLSLALALDAPKGYVTEVLKQQLAEVGITVKQQSKVRKLPTHEVARHQSAPLPELLNHVLAKSDNQISDSLLRTLGQQRAGIGSFEGGIMAVKAIVKEQLGLELSAADIYDGSGLSRYNLISPMMLAQLLQRWQQPQLAPLMAMLPIAGKSGTLRYRASLRGLEGQVTAKTGTFKQVSNLAGFVGEGDNQQIVVQFVTGINATNGNAKQQVHEFEQALFQCVLNDCFELDESHATTAGEVVLAQ
ncbi:D-alanyl-D-alanine carboxypeptidase/D-alanyl-D-alanine-endopeptidase [Ferrimonas senticii]|uniref:D-alanyl-D-alanine carboxypeptidase/D-alanyl-D-alanine endopeptidase n=1 Tax=Ferrimonas senticii TaxID=394566 RepID=UPI0004151E37|nr:D-alanyl-D-alanine carboxypeptidase/D-alanyl-D-alanine-endopeptidase [Ferrimonas senticii]